jgi:hypothetical protein
MQKSIDLTTIYWRKNNARRLSLSSSTDASFHYAGDGKVDFLALE